RESGLKKQTPHSLHAGKQRRLNGVLLRDNTYMSTDSSVQYSRTLANNGFHDIPKTINSITQVCYSSRKGVQIIVDRAELPSLLREKLEEAASLYEAQQRPGYDDLFPEVKAIYAQAINSLLAEAKELSKRL